jgi:GT2 family glycosyltransferase
MKEPSMPRVSILIPHYKTPALLKHCLALLQQYTPNNLAKYIVIDNDSQDESISYLQSLDWIIFIPRNTIPNESPAASHSRALDLGMEKVDTEFVLSIHTDTLVKHPEWLQYLLKNIEKNPNIAGVGSWKLENKPLYKRMLKYIERKFQTAYYKLINKTDHHIEGVGENNYFYLRSHCALYRTDLLKKYELIFDDNNEVAGKVMHKKLVDKGHEMIFLPSPELSKYLDHINHATMVLNPALGVSKRAIKQGMTRIKKVL